MEFTGITNNRYNTKQSKHYTLYVNTSNYSELQINNTHHLYTIAHLGDFLQDIIPTDSFTHDQFPFFFCMDYTLCCLV